MMVSFTIPGPAVGKGRGRVSTIGGRPRVFTPDKTVRYENLVAMAAREAMEKDGAEAFTGAVSVRLAVLCPIPASWSKKKQAAAMAGEMHPTTKPDVDNVIKSVFDGLNGVLWKDDVQATHVTVSKEYASMPMVVVQVQDYPYVR